MNNGIYIDLFMLACSVAYVVMCWRWNHQNKVKMLSFLTSSVIETLIKRTMPTFVLTFLILIICLLIMCWRLFEVLYVLNAGGVSAWLLMIAWFLLAAYQGGIRQFFTRLFIEAQKIGLP